MKKIVLTLTALLVTAHICVNGSSKAVARKMQDYQRQMIKKITPGTPYFRPSAITEYRKKMTEFDKQLKEEILKEHKRATTPLTPEEIKKITDEEIKKIKEELNKQMQLHLKMMKIRDLK